MHRLSRPARSLRSAGPCPGGAPVSGSRREAADDREPPHSRSSGRLIALSCALLCLALGALAPSARAATCGVRTPSSLHLVRLGGGSARLSWRIAAADGQGAVYRVLRGRRVVGQTSGTSIVLRVTPGRLSLFTVQARWPAPGTLCAASMRLRVAVPLPRSPGEAAAARADGERRGPRLAHGRPRRRSARGLQGRARRRGRRADTQAQVLPAAQRLPCAHGDGPRRRHARARRRGEDAPHPGAPRPRRGGPPAEHARCPQRFGNQLERRHDPLAAQHPRRCPRGRIPRLPRRSPRRREHADEYAPGEAELPAHLRDHGRGGRRGRSPERAHGATGAQHIPHAARRTRAALGGTGERHLGDALLAGRERQRSLRRRL